MRKLLVLSTLILASVTTAVSAAQVNVYSARKEALIKPLLDQFTAETGIQVRLLAGSGDALLTRLTSEGENTAADLFLTVDAGNLYRASEAGVFQPLGSAKALETVPEQWQGADGEWVALSLRARPIFYSPDRVDPSQLTGYGDLADPRWDNEICIRSSDNIYNQSLVAALIEHWGVEQTEEWANGLVENFARMPVGGDRDQIKAVAAGVCDLAVANTYYLGLMEASDNVQERTAAEQVKIFWPNQDSFGTHVNVSGIGLTKHAKNVESARKLVEFLLSDEAQQWYAKTNAEYPAVPGVEWSERLQAWGEFKMDKLPMKHLGENNPEAVKLMNRAGWR